MEGRAASGSVRLPAVFERFDAAYLGICAPHVWIYCVAHRGGVDYGGVPIGIPLYIALSAFMLVFMLLAWRGRAQRVAPLLDWPLAVVQAAATVVLAVPLPFDGAPTAALAAAAAGFGVAWLYLRWAPFYAGLDVRGAIACIFCAMAVGSALKIPVDLLPAPFPQRDPGGPSVRVDRPRAPGMPPAASARAPSRACSTTATPPPSPGRSCSAWLRTASSSESSRACPSRPTRCRSHCSPRCTMAPRWRWRSLSCGGCSAAAGSSASPACGAPSCCSRPRGCSSCRPSERSWRVGRLCSSQ